MLVRQCVNTRPGGGAGEGRGGAGGECVLTVCIRRWGSTAADLLTSAGPSTGAHMRKFSGPGHQGTWHAGKDVAEASKHAARGGWFAGRQWEGKAMAGQYYVV
jgi:hypothetical protein